MLHKSVLALSAALAFAGTAFATPVVLNPGTNSSNVVALTSANTGTFGGNLVAAIAPSPTVGQTTFMGSYNERVFADNTGANPYCSGCLDFVFNIDNVGSTGIIESATTSSFDSYLVSAAVASDPSKVFPIDVKRSPAGSGVITYDFYLTAGQSVQGLILYTNATAYQLGTFSLQDGTAGTGPYAYVPAGPQNSPVPEPSSLLLLGSGLVGAAGVGRRKFASIFKK